MEPITEIIDSLNKILLEKEPVRMELVKSFQNKVWNDEDAKDEVLNEILSELAYDLDFYEPNEAWRKEDVSYYSDERLNELIKAAIKKIEGYAKASPPPYRS